MRPLRTAARGGLCLGPEHLEGSRRHWGDAGSGGGGRSPRLQPPTLSPGTQAGLASLGKRRPVGACAGQLSQSQRKGRGSSLPGCPLLPGSLPHPPGSSGHSDSQSKGRRSACSWLSTPGQICLSETSHLSHWSLRHCKTEGEGSEIMTADCGLGLRAGRQGIDGVALVRSELGPEWTLGTRVQTQCLH